MNQDTCIKHNDTLPESCDIVVIGAGAGGLTTAALLAHAGLNVIVIEAESQPGGYLAGFQRRGFSFNTSIEWLNQCGPTGFVSNLFQTLGGNPPLCPPMQRIRRFKSDTFDYLLTSDPDELKKCLIKDFPESESGIREFFNDAKKLGQRLQLLDRKIIGSETLSLPGKIVRSLRMLWWILPVIKFIRTPVDKGLSRYFGKGGPRKIFNSQQTMMSIMVSIAWAYSRNYQACPVGGSSAIASFLCERIKSAGSLVVLNRRVDKVLVNNKKEATGVSLTDGRTVLARYVIAACDILALYEKMLPAAAVPPQLLKAVKQAELYHSCFSIFLGLDCHPSLLGFGEESLNLTRSDVSRADHSSGDPHRSHITVLAPSILDPSLAPPGKGTLIIHCPAHIDYQNNWQTGEGLARGKDYRALKKEVADILLDRVEADFSPGLRQHIEVMEIATPVTYWRYTGNTHGTFSGAKPTGKNIRAGVAHHQTPVQKLLLGGHCAEYGGGVPIAVKAAANACLIVLKDMNPEGYIRLKSIMTD